MPETKPFENYEYKAIEENSDKRFNRIIFGAPGTGKSFKIDEEKQSLEDFASYERVTFHPNYSYAQFVGTYKPVIKDNGEITYKYVEGPFMRLLAAALENAKDSNKDNRKRYLLIVEEINRANVAAVFGDLFQLLDRDSDGVSEYEIQTSEDVRKYLALTLGGTVTEEKYKTLRLPNNLYIWATMNSADQGVFPMDAAFKRRWNFEYLPIDITEFDGFNGKNRSDYTKEKYTAFDEHTFDVLDWEVEGEDGTKYNWYLLRRAINKLLKSKVEWINEDKLLGPWFIKPESGSNTISSDKFCSKVLMYLYEDVVKIEPSKIFSKENIIGDGDNSQLFYSDIAEKWKSNGIMIFDEACKTEYENLSK